MTKNSLKSDGIYGKIMFDYIVWSQRIESEGMILSKSMIKRLCSGAAVLCMIGCLPGCGTGSAPSSQVKEEVPEVTTVPFEPMEFKANTMGEVQGYNYELWKDKGDTLFTVKEAGNFSCEWNNINNALFRKGKKFDCTKTYDEFGNLSVDYGVDYQPDGNSYMCVYGWTREPLIEFYVVESWGSWRPPGEPTPLGTVKVDGGVYDIYKTTRVEQPSIDGTKTFDQYWSVRQEKPKADGSRIEGTISISKHFDAWKKCGLELGKMYEVALTIEGYQSAGKADVYKNELKEEGEYKEADDIEVKVNE